MHPPHDQRNSSGPSAQGHDIDPVGEVLWAYETAERLDRLRVRGIWISHLGLVSPLLTMPLMAIPHAAGALGPNPPSNLWLAALTFLIVALVLVSVAAVIPCFIFGSVLRLVSSWRLERHFRRFGCPVCPPLVAGERFGDWRIDRISPDGISMRRVAPVVFVLVLIGVAASFFIGAFTQILFTNQQWAALPLGGMGALIPAGVVLSRIRSPISWLVVSDADSPSVVQLNVLAGTLRTHRIELPTIRGWGVHDNSLWLFAGKRRYAVATVGPGKLGMLRAQRIIHHVAACRVQHDRSVAKPSWRGKLLKHLH